MRIMKYRLVFFAISLFFLIPSIYFLITFGLLPSIDFTGGSLLEIKVEAGAEPNITGVREAVGDIYEIDQMQRVGEDTYSIQGTTISNDQKDQVISAIEGKYGKVEPLRFETVGATVSGELVKKTATAILLVAGIITVYVWRQFSELKFGVSAILAMFHDSLILLGAFSILGYFWGTQVDVLFVTALLTTLSFSVHDTIVVYDRIRELSAKNARVKFETIIDTAVIETLGRSLNNSITIIIMLTALFMLGGDTIRMFSLALLIGAVTGTYSSTFVATPLLLLWDDFADRFAKAKSRSQEG